VAPGPQLPQFRERNDERSRAPLVLVSFSEYNGACMYTGRT
jgi:hypothetical protein